MPELVCGQVDCAEAASAYLLLDNVLVDAVDRRAVVVAAAVMRPRVERLLDVLRLGGRAAMVPDGALVGGSGP